MDKLKEILRFYFSLPNLANDNVLLLKLLYEKEVTLDFLMKFNKIAKILEKFPNSEEILVKTLVEMSDFQVFDRKVRLSNEISMEMIENHRKSAVFRSVYFENIPDDLDLERVLKGFGSFGRVSYVSLPKWPETGILKGFGFVEFEDVESCEGLMQVFPSFDPRELENIGKSVKIIRKTEWLQYKSRFSELKKILEADMPDQEFVVLASNIPERITKTQINNLLQIKPWKIEYKQSSGRAKLIYPSKIDVRAILRIQPSLLGQQVHYSFESKHNKI
jgi:hypothetical protein